jgi:hypothetical protein
MADATGQSPKTPWHVWVVGGVSLLWNSLGATDFVMTQTRNKAYMSGFTPAQLDFYYGFPWWVVTAWGIAVGSGVLGSLLLLGRKRQAVFFFALSLVGMVLTDIRNLAFADGFKVMGGVEALIFSAVIFLVGALLLLYSGSMCKRRVLG